ncbi:MAG: hypothetical protein WAK00_07405 [Microbacterium sp.]|uniref:O-antigen ligase family protein n=1 Tax=Microbacterium sp. TaxID=51671 RepID=UPI003BAFD7F8
MTFLIWLLAVATPFVAAVLASDANPAIRIVALLAMGFPLGIWVALRRPLWIYCGYAFALGAVPFGVLPSSPLPLVLLLGVSIGATAALQLPAGDSRSFTALEWWVLGLIATSILSLAVTYSTSYDFSEFAKWLIATATVFALLRLDSRRRDVVGRWYVFGATAASLYGLGMLFFDRQGKSLSMLSFLGYGGSGGDNLRYVVDGAERTVRLTGTYVDPNAGGLFLLLAVVLSLALFRGFWQIALTGITAAALVLTLSRAALGSLVVAFLIFMAVQNMRFGGKARIVALASMAGAALLMIPAVQDRLLDSFGANDAGSTARADALRDFPKHMDGQWMFGLGWGRIEFRDGAVGMAINHVANAPLLSIYRGGLIVGLFFAALLIYGLILSWRALRRPQPRYGYVGAGFIGLVLVALQLDFPVITIPPVVALFAFFLANLPTPDVYTARQTDDALVPQIPRAQRELRRF